MVISRSRLFNYLDGPLWNTKNSAAAAVQKSKFIKAPILVRETRFTLSIDARSRRFLPRLGSFLRKTASPYSLMCNVILNDCFVILCHN